MKKKFLMVISTITVITGLFILTTGSDKVRADESGDNSCETITNYYMFLDAVASSWFSEDWCTEHPDATTCKAGVNRHDQNGYHLNTQKNFNLGVKNKDNILEEGVLENIDYSKFFDIYQTLTDNEPKTYGSDTSKIYVRAEKWYNSTGEEVDSEPISVDKKTFLSSINPATDKKIELLYNETRASASIYRTWSDEVAKDIFDQQLAISYSPYVYYVTYSTCDNKYKVNVKYLEKGTDKELADPEVVKSGLNDGDNYEFTCKDNISKYDLVTKDKQSGKINGKDAEAVCYYEKKSYLLTINYGDDEECSNPLKDADTQSVKWGESVEVEPGNKIGSMTLTGLGTYSSQISPAPKYNNGVVTLTMPAKNASICVVYTPQTGSAIGKVMLLGLVALGGTMFFIKRNKEEDEIEA